MTRVVPESLPKYGRGDLRALLVQAAHVALRQQNHPLHAWAWKLCLRKSHKNVAVAAVARKLTVSIWYCLRGLFQPFEKIDGSLEQKIGRIATVLGQKDDHAAWLRVQSCIRKTKNRDFDRARLKTTCLPALCVPGNLHAGVMDAG